MLRDQLVVMATASLCLRSGLLAEFFFVLFFFVYALVESREPTEALYSLPMLFDIGAGSYL